MSPFPSEMAEPKSFPDGLRTMPPSILIATRATSMTPQLSERFRANRGEPIEVDGRIVQMLHRIEGLTSTDALVVRVVSVGSQQAQAVRLKAKGGRLLINGQANEDVVLWADAILGDEVEVSFIPNGPKTVDVLVWNAWKDDRGTMQAWIADAGLIVEPEGTGTTLLRCSDGYDAPVFEDLVVELRLEQTGRNPQRA
jgi:hypothetical protein